MVSATPKFHWEHYYISENILDSNEPASESVGDMFKLNYKTHHVPFHCQS